MKTFKIRGVTFGYAKNMIYCLEPVIVDIESSNNHAEDPQDLRTWITSIQVIFHNEYHLFRRPSKLIEWYRGIYKKYHLEPTHIKKRLITFIHNLSYDISYLYPYLLELPEFDDEYTGIIEAPNKFLSFVRGSLEFRCSYRLSGMSLEKWGNEMHVMHPKQIGLYDYDAILYQDDKIDDASQKYDLYDVLCLKECIEKQLEHFKDDLTSIPLTSTGYVRRALRRSCKKDKRYRKKYFEDNRLDPELFDIIQTAYAGGYTHNNRWYNDLLIRKGRTYIYHPTGQKIKVNNIRHRDFKSHYPTQMQYPLPLGRPQLIYENYMGYPMSIDDIMEMWPEFTSFCIMRIYQADIKDEAISMPFMQYAKCFNQDIEYKRLDNGRILNIKGQFDMCIDTLTLKIIAKQYNLEYEILKVYRMENMILPRCILDVVDKYFKGKSDKKNTYEELERLYGKFDERTIYAAFLLMNDKKMLNGIYGCTAMNPLRTEIRANQFMEFYITKEYESKEEIAAGLEKYYAGRNNFLPYSISGAITSAARYELFEFIEAIGYERCLYCDTDSIFYISDEKTEKRVEALNAHKKAFAPFVELDNGKHEYYNHFGLEPDCKAFKGLHAKCYGVVTDKGLELTIAGVPARTLIAMDEDKPVYITREQEMMLKKRSRNKKPTELTDADYIKDPIKALDRLTDEFTFTINTGVCALYIGALGFNSARTPEIIEIDGHKIETAGGCVIKKLKTKVVHNIFIDPINSDNYEMAEEIEDIR